MANTTNFTAPGQDPIVNANGLLSKSWLNFFQQVSVTAANLVKTTNNGSDFTNIPLVRTNLGLGNAATANIGTGAGQVAAGDDARIVNAVEIVGGALATVPKLAIGTGGPTISAGTAAPSGTEPEGSLYLRTGAGVGFRFYISTGAGWSATPY